jgi:hypothetical protein
MKVAEFLRTRPPSMKTKRPAFEFWLNLPLTPPLRGTRQRAYTMALFLGELRVGSTDQLRTRNVKREDLRAL